MLNFAIAIGYIQGLGLGAFSALGLGMVATITTLIALA